MTSCSPRGGPRTRWPCWAATSSILALSQAAPSRPPWVDSGPSPQRGRTARCLARRGLALTGSAFAVSASGWRDADPGESVEPPGERPAAGQPGMAEVGAQLPCPHPAGDLDERAQAVQAHVPAQRDVGDRDVRPAAIATQKGAGDDPGYDVDRRA